MLLALPVNSMGQFSYVTNNGTITISGYFGSGGAVVIPDSINGYSVTSIGDYAFFSWWGPTSVTIPDSVTNIGAAAFAYCETLTSVTIPDGVISIGVGAFRNCSGLASVTIPNSVSSIDGDVFWNCSGLTSVAIPNSVSNIVSGTFYGCSSLTNVTIPNSVTNIDSMAFWYCSSLTGTTIPESVTSIGDGAFWYCSGLMNISVSVGNSNYTSVDGVLFDKAISTLIQYPTGATNNAYSIPNSVTNIWDMAFSYSSSLESVTIPSSVTSIAWGAFDNSGLRSVIIPNSVASISDSVFYACSNLTNVIIPNNVTNISYGAFLDCSSLASVTIPNSVASIGYATFEGCSSLSNVFFLGNAPSVNGEAGSQDTSVFENEMGTVYYLSGATGWDSTFGSWPTAQWDQMQPQILDASCDMDAQSNRFNFIISWVPNVSVVVLASTNLQNWTPIATNCLFNGTSNFSETESMNHLVQFYRVRTL
jgi:hypothetical protein